MNHEQFINGLTADLDQAYASMRGRETVDQVMEVLNRLKAGVKLRGWRKRCAVVCLSIVSMELMLRHERQHETEEGT